MKIGIDLGGSHIAIGIVGQNNNIIVKREKDIIKKESEDETKKYILENIKILMSDVLKDVGAPSCVVSNIGIATPGKVIDSVIYDIYNLDIKEFNLAKELEMYYGAEVTVRNDAKCAGLAEKVIGNLRDYDDAVFLCLGTGIGGATFINGQMLEYSKHQGSEYGHMIIKKDGKGCKCGNKGCWETYASMKAFKDGAIERFNIRKDIESKELLNILLEKYIARDEELNKYIDEYLENLLIGFINIINIIEPEAICLGGGFVYFEKILYGKLKLKINEAKYNCSIPRIVLASLKNDAGIIGATL